mmetsp:Transcript_31883/g.97397  ORF Transcript_31883/g.97397 Transcript_31883/m.97397 type:complete len:141 (+) Transcript_31883:1125-1547(+)
MVHLLALRVLRALPVTIVTTQMPKVRLNAMRVQTIAARPDWVHRVFWNACAFQASIDETTTHRARHAQLAPFAGGVQWVLGLPLKAGVVMAQTICAAVVKPAPLGSTRAPLGTVRLPSSAKINVLLSPLQACLLWPSSLS